MLSKTKALPMIDWLRARRCRKGNHRWLPVVQGTQPDDLLRVECRDCGLRLTPRAPRSFHEGSLTVKKLARDTRPEPPHLFDWGSK